MMRSFLYLVAALGVIGLAYWAYSENYATQATLKRVEKLQQEIGAVREHLGVLRAEWAYLNRPARLRELADLNYKSLKLIPLSPDHFGNVEQVAYPRGRLDGVKKPVDLSASSAPASTGKAGK